MVIEARLVSRDQAMRCTAEGWQGKEPPRSHQHSSVKAEMPVSEAQSHTFSFNSSVDLQVGNQPNRTEPKRERMPFGRRAAARCAPSRSDLSALLRRRGGFTQGPNQSHVAPSAAVQGGFAGQERTHRATEPRFARRY